MNQKINRSIGWCWCCGLSLLLSIGLSSCTQTNSNVRSSGLNSRFNEEQPAISGDGRYLAFVSNRDGSSQIYVYDLDQKQYVQLPGLETGAIAASPSLSITGRYLAYIYYDGGRPEIALYDRAIQRSQILTPNYRSWLKNLHISPNGRYLVFETARRGQWDVEVLDRGPNVELDIADGSVIVE